MILSGRTIKKFDIVRPCVPRTKEFGMTYGLGPAGYDIRVEFDSEGRIPDIDIKPGGFRLASSLEKLYIPNFVMGIVHDKSSWARRGIALQNTVLEPGWSGYITLEITNHGHVTRKIERGAPIAQIVFHYIDQDVVGYDGKYQDQPRGPVEAIHEK